MSEQAKDVVAVPRQLLVSLRAVLVTAQNERETRHNQVKWCVLQAKIDELSPYIAAPPVNVDAAAAATKAAADHEQRMAQQRTRDGR